MDAVSHSGHKARIDVDLASGTDSAVSAEPFLPVARRRLRVVILQFIDHRRGSADQYSWVPPFDWSVGYGNDQWWDDVRYYYVSEPWFVQVLEGGVEVARVELDDPGGINPEYTGVPDLAEKERLEIQLIEVATAAGRRGIGTRVVEGLAERHRDRRLFAYSEEADPFWASLGWDRFDHRDGQPQFHRALFIQPTR